MKTAYDHLVDLLVNDSIGWKITESVLTHIATGLTLRWSVGHQAWTMDKFAYAPSYWEARRLKKAVKECVATQVLSLTYKHVGRLLPYPMNMED